MPGTARGHHLRGLARAPGRVVPGTLALFGPVLGDVGQERPGRQGVDPYPGGAYSRANTVVSALRAALAPA
jgi:hypothetical protein